MNRIDLEKFIGAALGTLVFVFSVGFLSDAIYHPAEHAGGGYTLEEPEEGGTETAAVEEDAVPLAELLMAASAEDGEGVFKKCAACHTAEEGGANKVGPALYGVVGRAIGGVDGFAYSDVFQGLNAEGKVWTYEDLNAFLESPKNYAPGTKMSFAGLRKETDRADLLAYMQTLSGSPVPFPAVEEAPAAEAEAGDAEAVPSENTTPAGVEEADPEVVQPETEPAADEEAPAASEEPATEEETPAADDASTEETSGEESN